MNTGEFYKREYWLSFARGLNIDDRSLLRDVPFLEMSQAEQESCAALLKEEGYFQGSANWGLDLRLMADTVRALSAEGLSPVFAYLYDEFWYPFLELHRLYETLLGGRYCLLPDFWVWNVDPKKSESGWAPHRDKGRAALREDGSPKSLTTWIPLSPSTPLNGCIYIVPAQHDPAYGTANEKQRSFEYQGIRALPGQPGDFFIWNQAVMHWGGRASPRAPESRVSMAFEFQRSDVRPFNNPLIDSLRVLSFEARLQLIAKQIYQYQHMYPLDPNVAVFASELVARTKPQAGLASGTLARSAERYPSDPSSWGKVGRNEPCPCGSGKKYKQCHGGKAISEA
jgi:ectoine hydroxylase-related dioxygenase (phytanoyl-CoA dioxygenase family)